MHYLYIIYSRTIDRYYVGESVDAVIRLEQHNDHCFKKGYTKAATDWKIVLSYSCRNREEALYLERFIKRMKSKTFIKKIIDKPEILADILANK